MSQTETILLVVLGFALATLLALFMGRLLWSAALRLGARRMQRQVPSTLVGLQTERDRLRAEYAMMSERLGSRVDALKQRLAEQMAEVSRHRNRLELMERNLADRLAAATAEGSALEAMRANLAAAEAAKASLEQEIAVRDGEIARLRAELAERPPMPAPVVAEVAPPPVDDKLQSHIDRLHGLAEEVAQERTPLPDTDASTDTGTDTAAEPPIEARLAEAERETDDLQKELEKLDAEWSKRLETLQSGDPAAPTAVANVISLANRIRDLKKGTGPST